MEGVYDNKRLPGKISSADFSEISFVASSAFSLKELVFISSPINTYEFSVGNPTSNNTTAYIRVYTIYV